MNKIVFYSERWLDGGIETLIMNIITKSQSAKYKYKIIVGQKETLSYDDLIKKYNVEFVEIHKKHIKNPIIRTINSILKFKKSIQNEVESIIHINIYNSVGLVLGLFVKNKKNVVIHAHNNGIDKDNDKFYIKRLANSIFKLLYTSKKYNYFACSDLAANFCFDTKKIDKYYIMKNGIDSKKFEFNLDDRNRIRNDLNINNDTILFGHVGRFVYQKNHNFLIDVFKKYYDENNNAKLLLIGSGPLKKEIKKKVNLLNLNDSIIFLGNTDKVNEYMSAMDIFLFPSFYEGLGITLIEAQCSDLPCIATQGLPKMVKVTDNLEFLNLDINLWTNKIVNLIVDERCDQSINIKEKGYDIFDSVDSLEKEYEVIFNETK